MAHLRSYKDLAVWQKSHVLALGFCAERDFVEANDLCNEVGKMLWAWRQSQIRNKLDAT